MLAKLLRGKNVECKNVSCSPDPTTNYETTNKLNQNQNKKLMKTGIVVSELVDAFREQDK